MYKATIDTIPHRDQRYDTIGDWYQEGARQIIRISSMGCREYEFLVAIHEMVEAELCRKMGISEQTVDAWDLAHEDEEEPGAMEKCPYREAHMRAEAIERVLANDLGVDWEHYSKTVKATVEKTPLPTDPTTHNKKLGEDYQMSYNEYRNNAAERRAMEPHGGHSRVRMKAKDKARSVLRDR